MSYRAMDESRSSEQIDADGLYAAIVQVERLRVSSSPLNVVGYINHEFSIRRRSPSVFPAYRMALEKIRQDLACLVAEPDLIGCACKLEKQVIKSEMDLWYLEEYKSAFPEFRPFHDLCERARKVLGKAP